MEYIPPYAVTEEMLELVSSIMENLGKLGFVNDMSKMPKLRRTNRIKSIHSSLAIEHNSLSIEQVSDIIDGKRVLGKPDEIKEVKNAIDAYKLLDKLDCYKMEDLLRAHKAMTCGLIEESGVFRSGEEGVFAGDKCIHIAPPARNVNELMTKLFSWLQNSKVHPLIKSSVFHYELEFIHPFKDGNGRIGRFWQTIILSKWREVFAWLPVESMIIKKQEEYYQAINKSTAEGNSNSFIIFMLKMFLESIVEIADETTSYCSHLSGYVEDLIAVMDSYPMSANQIMDKLALNSKESFRIHYLRPALESGIVAMTIPDKPSSKNQRYYKKI